MTNLSLTKIQCCKSGEFCTYNWSIVCKQRWNVSYNLAFRRTSTSSTSSSTCGRHFLLNFPYQRSSFNMKLTLQIARQKVVFLRQFFRAFCLSLLVLKGQTRSIPKLSRSLYRVNVLLSESFWSTWNSSSFLPSARFYLFAVLPRLATANNKR